jgi:hypothetical protein
LFPIPAKIGDIRPDGAKMLAGIVVSAVMGGLAGLAFSLSHESGLLETLLAYQIGGLLAVMAFMALARPMRLRRS